MPLPRFRIRTLMIAVAVVALLCVPGVALVRWYMRPRVQPLRYYSKYVAPDGKVYRGVLANPDGDIIAP